MKPKKVKKVKRTYHLKRDKAGYYYCTYPFYLAKGRCGHLARGKLHIGELTLKPTGYRLTKEGVQIRYTAWKGEL